MEVRPDNRVHSDNRVRSGSHPALEALRAREELRRQCNRRRIPRNNNRSHPPAKLCAKRNCLIKRRGSFLFLINVFTEAFCPRATKGPTDIYTLNEEPQPQVLFTFGFSNLKPAPSRLST